jgi:hypothetical protein
MGTASAMVVPIVAVATTMPTTVAIVTVAAVTFTVPIAKNTVAVINNSSLCVHGNTPIR